MRCDECHRENREEARFCDGCGAPLLRRCPACGRELRRDALFCDGCGHRLQPPETPRPPRAKPPERDPRSYTPRHLAERILTQKSALEGERKHVTVLFADLADSTSLAERLDPEDMHALMDRCFAGILEEVHRYEGTVNQFLGDGVLALFGAPLALEDAPRRAVLAALGIQRGLQDLDRDVSDRHGVPFRMRIGIHSGVVVVGRIGDDLRMDYTAVGDTTNLAARLEQAAEPGAILISEATESLVSGYFELRDVGALQLKGKSAPMRAFQVLGERPDRGRIDVAAERGLTPLVGRERELDTLRATFESARRGRGQMAFVVGEAGMGKSRLLYEFRRSLEGTPHIWMEGRCSPYGRTAAFGAIADALRRLIGIQEGDADALSRLEAFEATGGSDLAWTRPYVRGLLSLPVGDPEVERMDAATRRSETFRALRAGFLQQAERAPVVVAFEDLHWIDPASQEFLAYLADSVPAARALLLFTWRPDYRHPFGERSYHVRLALQALSDGETTSMAGSLLAAPSVPESLRRIIVRKAEGNPFFIEEVTRSLVEEGVLRVRDGRVELTRNISEIAVPDSIQDVLMARIDRLEEEPKRAIQVASVIGREFALRLLGRIHEAGDRIRDVVEDLQALELIYEKAAHPELAFMFKHALTHDVAYQSVLRQRRKTLHRVVGRAIEELYADRLTEHYEALAHHFLEAEDWEKAFLYCERASAKAEAAFANQSAAELCQRALEIAAHLGGRVPPEAQRRLEERLGRVFQCTSEFLDAGEAFERAAALAEDPGERAADLARAGYAYLWGHQYARAEEILEAGHALAREAGDPDGQAFARLVQGFHAAVAGDPVRSERLTREGRALAPQHPEVLLVANHHRGWEAELQGDFPLAERTLGETVEGARKHRLPVVLAAAIWSRGKALCGMGVYGDALATFREGLDLAERTGNRAMRARALNTLGWLHAEIGDDTGAEELNLRSMRMAQEMLELGLVTAAPEILGNAAANLAGNRVAFGDLDGADEVLAPVRETIAKTTDPWMLWRYTLHVLHADARIALARGDAEAASRLAAQEAREARQRRAAKIEMRALELRGRALAAMDLRGEARSVLQEALAGAERLGYPPVQWRARALLGELLRRDGSREAADAELSRARSLVLEHAATIPQEVLRRSLHALGDRLLADPLEGRR